LPDLKRIMFDPAWLRKMLSELILGGLNAIAMRVENDGA
jgi:hypothetical protein